jgi:hypothetical protein
VGRYEVIAYGDLNDYDPQVPDINGDEPTSQVRPRLPSKRERESPQGVRLEALSGGDGVAGA